MLHPQEHATVVDGVCGVKLIDAGLEEGLVVLVETDAGVIHKGGHRPELVHCVVHRRCNASLRPDTTS